MATEELPEPTDLPSALKVLEAVLTEGEHVLAKLEALPPPHREAQTLERELIGRLRQDLAQVQDVAAELKAALAAGDRRGMERAAARLDALGSQPDGVDAFLRSFGATDCLD